MGPSSDVPISARRKTAEMQVVEGLIAHLPAAGKSGWFSDSNSRGLFISKNAYLCCACPQLLSHGSPLWDLRDCSLLGSLCPCDFSGQEYWEWVPVAFPGIFLNL